MTDNKNHYGTRRRAATLAVMASIALLTAACGGATHGSGGSPSGSSSSADESSAAVKLVAYAHCLTSHGVPGVSVSGDDTLTIDSANGQMTLSGGGGIPPQVADTSPALESAAKACNSLLPVGGRKLPSGQVSAQDLQQGLKYAQCLRKHGVPNMPDPSSNGQFALGGTGINTQSPQFEASQQDCKSEMPPQIGFNDNSRVSS
jgi:hypothetical protein